MKRNVIFYAITAAGDEIKYVQHPLRKPEHTKLWKRLNTGLNTGEFKQIGYKREKPI